mgnify:CR=1 FL=1
MPAFPELDSPLADPRVALRLSAERDIPEVLIAYQDDPQLHLALGEARPPSGAQLGRRAEELEAERGAGSSLILAILAPGEDVCRGEVRVASVDWEHRRAELTWWVVPQLRGRGMGAAALRLASTWLIESAGLVRVALTCPPGHPAALAAAAAAGFQQEGVLRGYLPGDGQRLDVTVLSRVRRDLAG